MSIREKLGPSLPYLRRYARALTGSQASGDAYVHATLSAILASEKSLDQGLSPHAALYKIFHAIWLGTAISPKGNVIDLRTHEKTPDEKLNELAPISRAALLLTAVEGFDLAETASILGTS